jgi:hypothetical protein
VSDVERIIEQVTITLRAVIENALDESYKHGVAAERVPTALTRLAELQLATKAHGKWSLTEAGAEMAIAVKAEELG